MTILSYEVQTRHYPASSGEILVLFHHLDLLHALHFLKEHPGQRKRWANQPRQLDGVSEFDLDTFFARLLIHILYIYIFIYVKSIYIYIYYIYI